MIRFRLNGEDKIYSGDMNRSLLSYLRKDVGLVSPKDGCSGQAACGACTVEMDGKAILSCSMRMNKIDGAEITTIEGIPAQLKHILASSFVHKGAVQCGFCTPGLLMRTKVLLQKNPHPSQKEIRDALQSHLCRCTGYVKIVDAIQYAAQILNDEIKPNPLLSSGEVGTRYPKYDAYQKALGKSPFMDDIKIENMLHGVLKFSDFPRARILKIDFSEAMKLEGVVKIITANDIPGDRYNGLIIQDWPIMVDGGETTRYIGDVLACVVANSENIARQAAGLIKIKYKVLEPIDDALKAKDSPTRIHKNGNLLESCTIRRGKNADVLIKESPFVVNRVFTTQRVEHAFLEMEAAIAQPKGENGIELYAQSQGVYEDQKQVARILGISKENVHVSLVPTGGAFGGKEDMTVQPFAAISAYLLKKPVKVRLDRNESIRMHPKRHPLHMNYTVCCDKNGRLTLVKARIVGDTGAYASVGMKVLERAAGHAAGAYFVPNVDIHSEAVYTNNIPSGAMRGFGVNQVTFAMESCIDELCEKGGFDRWQFRYDNALREGSQTTTGQVLEHGVGVRACLNALKEEYDNAQYSGLALGIKNTGIGNGMTDECTVKIEIKAKDDIIVHHGWTEMGQGVDTMAIQFLCQETGLDPDIIRVIVSTQNSAPAGMTTASRGTSLLGNAIIRAASKLKADLERVSVTKLVGKTYTGKWSCDWTTKPGASKDVITHYSYSYAAQLVTLDKNGKIETVYAAHDAGKIINPGLFEGQIEGAIHMGLGYALTEELPMKGAKLVSTKLKSLGIIKAGDVPKIVVKGVEVKDPIGPYGAKGVGEIGLVPTAAAVANAYKQFDGIRRTRLPMDRD